MPVQTAPRLLAIPESRKATWSRLVVGTGVRQPLLYPTEAAACCPWRWIWRSVRAEGAIGVEREMIHNFAYSCDPRYRWWFRCDPQFTIASFFKAIDGRGTIARLDRHHDGTTSMSETVLVNGGTGFVGDRCIVELLRRGYTVRTTVRSIYKAPAVRAAVASAVDPSDGLTFYSADLTKDDGGTGRWRVRRRLRNADF
jgi:NAD dependent epimerase/dehydratase family